jgi:hypothetical protein
MSDSPVVERVDAEVSPKNPQPASVWEDFIDILYAPAQVFARRENGSFWIPFLVVSVTMGILMYANSSVLEPAMDAEFKRAMQTQMSKNPQFTPEMVEQSRSFAGAFGRIVATLFAPIGILLVGVTLWVVGRFFESKQTIHTAMVVAAYSFVPRIVEAALLSVSGLMMDPAQIDGRNRLTFGVGRFLDPDTVSPGLVAFLTRVDIFTIWVTVLLAIGLAVTGKISRGQAAIAAAIVWLLGSAPILFTLFG